MPFTISEGINIPDGQYLATLESVEVENTGGFDGTGFRTWNWLVDVNGEMTPLSAVTSHNTGPKSKAYAWLTALLRRPLLAGEQLDDPVGQRVMITIGRNAKGYASITGVAAFGDEGNAIAENLGIPR